VLIASLIAFSCAGMFPQDFDVEPASTEDSRNTRSIGMAAESALYQFLYTDLLCVAIIKRKKYLFMTGFYLED
jgi:hypothetical protein